MLGINTIKVFLFTYMLHRYGVDTCELCAIAIKSQHLLVPFSNNLAVEFYLLKATKEIALEDFTAATGYAFVFL